MKNSKKQYVYSTTLTLSEMNKATATEAGFTSLKEAKLLKKEISNKREERAKFHEPINWNYGAFQHRENHLRNQAYDILKDTHVHPANYEIHFSVGTQFSFYYDYVIDYDGYSKHCKYPMKIHHYYITLPRTGIFHEIMDGICTVYQKTMSIGEVTVGQCFMLFPKKGGIALTCSKGWFAKANAFGFRLAAHGETRKQALRSLQYKINRCVSIQKRKDNLTLDTVLNMRSYREITGACEMGCKEFCDREGLPYNVKLSVRELLEHLKTTDYGYSTIMKLLV